MRYAEQLCLFNFVKPSPEEKEYDRLEKKKRDRLFEALYLTGNLRSLIINTPRCQLTYWSHRNTQKIASKFLSKKLRCRVWVNKYLTTATITEIGNIEPVPPFVFHFWPPYWLKFRPKSPIVYKKRRHLFKKKSRSAIKQAA